VTSIKGRKAVALARTARQRDTTMTNRTVGGNQVTPHDVSFA
jgi:hypothetical protein